MRRSLIAVACFLTFGPGVWLLPANAQDATPAATPGVASSPAAGCVAGTEEQNVALARRWFAVWGSPDAAGFEAIAQPDIVHHWGVGEDTTSVADLRARTQVFASAFPDPWITLDQVIADGDYVVVRWTHTATQTGQFFDLEPSGIQATWTGINIFRFECGRIAESWNEFDAVGLRAQLTGMTDPIAGDLATPSVPATPVADCAPTSERDAVDVALQWAGVWGSGDVDLFDELAAPASVHHWGLGQDTMSLQDFKDRIGAFFAAVPDMHSTTEAPIVEGNLVAIRWTNTGTQTGPLFGFEPTGASLTWTGINIFRVECGQIVESWSEADGLGLRAQLEAASGAATPAA